MDVQDLEGLDRTRNLLGQGAFSKAHSQTHTDLSDPSPSWFFMSHSLEDPDSHRDLLWATCCRNAEIALGMTSHSLQNGNLFHQVQNCFRYQCRFPKIKRHCLSAWARKQHPLPREARKKANVCYTKKQASASGRGHLPMDHQSPGRKQAKCPSELYKYMML